MARPIGDTVEARKQVHINLRKAFSLINKSINDEIYIAAYVTAFSIIEDRVFSMYVVAKRVETGEIAITKNPRDVMMKYINYLEKKKTIPLATAKKIEAEIKARNSLLHGAMWRLDEFDKEMADRALNLAKEINALRTAQRKEIGIGYKVD
jgi:hypothetical protein